MDDIKRYELARRRLDDYQKNKTALVFWLAGLTVMIVVTMLAGRMAYTCLIPITAIVGLFTLVRGISVFYARPSRVLSESLIDKEMGWLFGDNWQDQAGEEEYDFASQRIRQRQAGRWYVLLHLLVFLPVSGFLFTVGSTFDKYREPGSPWIYAIIGIWAMVVLWDIRNRFPTSGMLRRREREAVQLLQQALGSGGSIAKLKLKHSDKSTAAFSEDGKLEELPPLPK